MEGGMSSNFWRAVTGFANSLFKSNSNKDNNRNKENKDMDSAASTNTPSHPEEDANNEGSDSDADDEDFVPNEANEGAGSEELSDDDCDEEGSPRKKNKTDKKSGKKRKATTKPGKAVNGIFKRRRLQRNKAPQDSDDEEDADFVLSESHNSSRVSYVDEDGKVPADHKAAQEAEEKADTDRLWASFLSSVNEAKEKKRGQDRTVEKVVSKIVDFAGEKISVQETVKVTVGSGNINGIISNSQDSPISSVSTLDLSDVSTSNASSSTRIEDEPVPGPSSAMMRTTTNGESKPKPAQRRGGGGISILGNDPETIGLDELDKRGLSGLLKAFQNKAAAAKRIGTLEKSKLDWEQYKRTQGLQDELTHHNRSRDTFIDKQEFLQRTDYRQFEIEKSMRATQRSKRLAN